VIHISTIKWKNQQFYTVRFVTYYFVVRYKPGNQCSLETSKVPCTMCAVNGRKLMKQVIRGILFSLEYGSMVKKFILFS
jgi:hypothetical protein